MFGDLDCMGGSRIFYVGAKWGKAEGLGAKQNRHSVDNVFKLKISKHSIAFYKKLKTPVHLKSLF